uniref:LRRNT domain-containing protein n=1 Tax=Ditylum brightwellii TaxID=49249 RepID=A0A7S4QET3_9STRA
MTGSVPAEIYNIDFLLQLDLNDNLLTGTIATEIGDVRYLQFVQIENNKFTGTVPTEMGNLVFMSVFDAFSNELTGSMPQEVCNLRNQFPDDPVNLLEKLTVDCNTTAIFQVNCPVPDCCTSCG